MKTPQPRKHPLYQVSVEHTETGELMTVGPAMHQQAAEMFAASIREQVRAGREKTWANPQVTRVLNLH